MKNIMIMVFVFVFSVVFSISSPNAGMVFASNQNVDFTTKNVIDYCIVSVNSKVFNNNQFKKTVITSLSNELTILVKEKLSEDWVLFGDTKVMFKDGIFCLFQAFVKFDD